MEEMEEMERGERERERGAVVMEKRAVRPDRNPDPGSRKSYSDDAAAS